MSLSVVVNTKNSAETLARTLKSVRSLADEIIVVDMKSTDDTVKVAHQFTKKVFKFAKDVGYVEPARNYALSKATRDWILILDADEEVSPGLAETIRRSIENSTAVDAYFIPRQNIVFGKKIEKTGWWPDFQLRLFKQGKVVWTDQVHSVPIIHGPVEYFAAEPEKAIIHHNYQTVSQFIERLNRYTTIQATNGAEDKKVSSFAPAKVLSTYWHEFFRRFFLEHGVDEGMHGTSLSVLQSMYEVVVYLKQWEAAGFPGTQGDQTESIEVLCQLQKDLNYWLASYRADQAGGLAKLIWQVRRKWKI